MMSDEDLLQQAMSCPTFYLDGFTNYRNINGVLRCIGFTIGNGAQLNLVISLAGTEVALREARRALDEPPIRGAVWGGERVSH
jgi:hypothetical protein